MNQPMHKEIRLIVDCLKIRSNFYTAQSGYKIAYFISVFPPVSFSTSKWDYVTCFHYMI